MDATSRRFTDEVVSDEMAAILRAKTPAERLAIVFGMWRSAQRMIFYSTKQKHPEWTDEEIQRHTARRTSHGAV